MLRYYSTMVIMVIQLTFYPSPASLRKSRDEKLYEQELQLALALSSQQTSQSSGDGDVIVVTADVSAENSDDTPGHVTSPVPMSNNVVSRSLETSPEIPSAKPLCSGVSHEGRLLFKHKSME